MKKLMIVAIAAALCGAAFGEQSVSSELKFTLWNGDTPDPEYRGCEIGFTDYSDKVTGAQLNVFTSRCNEFQNGLQYTLFGYNRATICKRGVQIGWFNRAESSSLQLGLICFNKTGFLPWFVFFNFDPAMFKAN